MGLPPEMKEEMKKKPDLKEVLGKFGTDAKGEDARLISFARRIGRKAHTPGGGR